MLNQVGLSTDHLKVNEAGLVFYVNNQSERLNK